VTTNGNTSLGGLQTRATWSRWEINPNQNQQPDDGSLSQSLIERSGESSTTHSGPVDTNTIELATDVYSDVSIEHSHILPLSMRTWAISKHVYEVRRIFTESKNCSGCNTIRAWAWLAKCCDWRVFISRRETGRRNQTSTLSIPIPTRVVRRLSLPAQSVLRQVVEESLAWKCRSHGRSGSSCRQPP